jgi:hypothetical protein
MRSCGMCNKEIKKDENLYFKYYNKGLLELYRCEECYNKWDFPKKYKNEKK